MLTRRRNRAKDRLSVTDTVTLGTPADKTAVAEWIAEVRPIGRSFGGIEWQLRNIEEIWQEHASVEGAADPEEHSLAWYADQILLWVRRARQDYESKNLESLALNALRIGSLQAEGRWRTALGPAAQYVRKVKAKSIRAGRRRGRDAHADAIRQDKRLLALAGQLRAKHPRDAEHSTRWLANEIARRVERPNGTIRDRLRRLGIT